MDILAEWVHRSIVKTLIIGILISLLFAAGVVCAIIIGIMDNDPVSLFCGGGLAIAVFALSVTVTVLKVRSAVRQNNDEDPPIYADLEKNLICFNNGKYLLEIPYADFCRAKGKHARYFHLLPGGFISWGTYNYGKVIVRYLDEDKKRKFVIKYVLEPEAASYVLENYIQKRLNFKDLYALLRIDADASQKEIEAAYNRLISTDPDNLDELKDAYKTLSDHQKKALYDVEYWKHNQ